MTDPGYSERSSEYSGANAPKYDLDEYLDELGALAFTLHAKGHSGDARNVENAIHDLRVLAELRQMQDEPIETMKEIPPMMVEVLLTKAERRVDERSQQQGGTNGTNETQV